MDWVETPGSTNVAAVAHDARGDLWVRFVSGTEGRYVGVPAAVYRALLGASSRGQFLAREIKTRYPWVPGAAGGD